MSREQKLALVHASFADVLTVEQRQEGHEHRHAEDTSPDERSPVRDAAVVPGPGDPEERDRKQDRANHRLGESCFRRHRARSVGVDLLGVLRRKVEDVDEVADDAAEEDREEGEAGDAGAEAVNAREDDGNRGELCVDDSINT